MDRVMFSSRLYAWLRRSTLALGLFVTLANVDASSGYADVAPGSWSAPYIAAIRDAGITQGCGGNNFCPSASVTREQMAAFLIRALADEPPLGYCDGGTPFTDVPANGWACRYIKRLGELGVTTGCGGGRYCPGAVVTREQMAVFIVRAMEGEPSSDSCAGQAPFGDVAATSWACGHIKRLAELGVTQGCGNGNYCPLKPVRRDEMAAFLARAFLGTNDPDPNHLQVSRYGPGRVYGTGIDCGSLCNANFANVISLLLYAEAESDAIFLGWGGACAAAGSTPTCLVQIEGNTQVSATFDAGDDDENPSASFPLNDTGLDWCANATHNNLACPVSEFPGQDAESGRDVTHNDDSDGHAGFSFTKISNSGYDLPNSAALGSGANDWGCTRDNVTGLIWEIKTNDNGLRAQRWRYSWYNPDATTNGGDAGKAANGICYSTARCDTDKYVADVNSQGLCGAFDWRLPNRFELVSLTSNDRYNPAIDTAFFPNTTLSWFWSSSPYADSVSRAWGVDFISSRVFSYIYKNQSLYVRLVRGGQ